MGRADDAAIPHGDGGRVLERLPALLVDDRKDPLETGPRGLRGLPAGEPLRLGVQEDHPAENVGADDTVADARQRDPQGLALACDLVRGSLASPQGPVDEIDEGTERQQTQHPSGQVEAARPAVARVGTPQPLRQDLVLRGLHRRDETLDRGHRLLAAVGEQHAARLQQPLLLADLDRIVRLFQALTHQRPQALDPRLLRRIVTGHGLQARRCAARRPTPRRHTSRGTRSRW